MILAIDPSLNSVGWAFASSKELKHGTIRTSDTLSLERRLRDLSRELGALSARLKPLYVYVEEAEQWGSFKSASSQQSGDLLKLAFATGAIVGAILTSTVDFAQLRMITVRQHKGQLKKPQTQKRLKEMFPSLTWVSHDEADALWILYKACLKLEYKLTEKGLLLKHAIPNASAKQDDLAGGAPISGDGE